MSELLPEDQVPDSKAGSVPVGLPIERSIAEVSRAPEQHVGNEALARSEPMSETVSGTMSVPVPGPGPVSGPVLIDNARFARLRPLKEGKQGVRDARRVSFWKLRVEGGAARDPWAHRRGEPRTFALLWMFFMVAAIFVSLAPAGASSLMSVDTYKPTARALAALMAAGVGVVWPMLRLSQVRPLRPMRALVQDIPIVLVPVGAMCAAQTAPWMAGWPIEVSIAMFAAMSAWTLVVGGVMLNTFASETGKTSQHVGKGQHVGKSLGDEGGVKDSVESGDVPERDEVGIELQRLDPRVRSGRSGNASVPRRLMDRGVGERPDAGLRATAMVVLAVVAIAGPLVSVIRFNAGKAIEPAYGIGIDWAMLSSPIGMMLEIAKDRSWTGRSAMIAQEHWLAIAIVFLCGTSLIFTGWVRVRARVDQDEGKP